MNHIGNVIKEYRNMLHMSRNELSDNICTEKYLYMIEKGERTPSTEITRLLGYKLGVDLSQYNQFLDCSDPIQLSMFLEKFYKLRSENNLHSLEEVTKEALQLQDFTKTPWYYEIQLNYLSIKVLGNGDYHNSIPLIQVIISEMNQKRLYNFCLVSYYVLLSTCYQMAHDFKSAKKYVLLAYKAIEGKDKLEKYVQVILAVRINKITLHYLSEELDAVIEDSYKLIDYQNDMCYQVYLHHTLFYLAFAKYQKGLEEEGIEWFIKALSLMVVHRRDMDLYFMIRYEMFGVMLHDKRVPRYLINMVKKTYSSLTM